MIAKNGSAGASSAGASAVSKVLRATSSGVAEERWFFEASGRPLYAVMHRGGRPDLPLVMFCNSFAADHDSKWRAEVVGARLFADRGYTTFSYHPRGHGDSAGNFADLTFTDLVEDAASAAACAVARTGARRVAWVGIRFGAMIAAEALRNRDDTIGLALWEPIHGAREYFTELMRQNVYKLIAAGRKPTLTVEQMVADLSRHSSVAVTGFDLYRTFSASAMERDLYGGLDGWTGPTLIAQYSRRGRLAKASERLRKFMQRRGAQVDVATFTQAAGRSARYDPWWFTEDLARYTGDWLDGLA
jgi:pimeloyl-ACP methyl ester carboxylesterase